MRFEKRCGSNEALSHVNMCRVLGVGGCSKFSDRKDKSKAEGVIVYVTSGKS